jgi:hypothetical protein
MVLSAFFKVCIRMIAYMLRNGSRMHCIEVLAASDLIVSFGSKVSNV